MFDLESSSSPSIHPSSLSQRIEKRRTRRRKTEPKRSSHNHCCIDKSEGGRQATYSPPYVYR
jgi:hypothetical protein